MYTFVTASTFATMLKTHTQHTIIMFTNVDIRQRWIKGPGKNSLQSILVSLKNCSLHSYLFMTRSSAIAE